VVASQQSKVEQFRKLHIPGNPLVLYHIWDPGSAKAAEAAGAKAIATSSWAVAEANGFSDGEQVPFGLVIDNLRRIVNTTTLPVTVDLESGYGATPEEVRESIDRAIIAGAIGCNLEDSFPENGRLREIVDQATRIHAAREAAKAASLAFFINARTDVFISTPSEQHNIAMVGLVLKRAEAYKQAGADGIFVPGLTDIGLITELTEASPLPVNIMVDGATPLADLAKAKVARVSYGATPYATLVSSFEDAARAVHG
jgi:2-methylisocitrate lyase-like PEP mutase family enzyme